MKKKLIHSFVASTILGTSLLGATPVLADEYDERIQEAQQQAQQNEQAANSLDQLINQLTNDVQGTQAALEQLNAEIEKNETSLQTTLDDLQLSKQEMERLQEEIAVLEENIANRSEQLKDQARTVQVKGNPSNYFEFILDAKSLTDVIGRIDIVNGLVNSSNSMIEDQINDQQAVEEKSAETEQKIAQQNALAGQLEETAADLEVQKVSQTALVAQLELEKNSATSDREALLTQRNEALMLVSDIENERETVRLAAERETAEQEEAEQVAQATSTEAEEVTPASSSRESAAETQRVEVPVEEPSNSEPAPEPEPVRESAPSQQDTSKPNPEPKPKEKSEPKPEPKPSGNVLSIAAQYIGVPYKWAGTTPGGFDCSGFTQYVFSQAGKSIPRNTRSQYADATKVSNPQPGDLVFFSNGRNGYIDHVGIVTGGGRFIGSQSSTGVAYASYTSGYWGTSGRVVGFGRY